MKKLFLAALPLVLVAGAPVLATAASDDAAPAGQASMKAGFDRQTGRFRDLTAEEQAELRGRGNGRLNAQSLMRRAGIAQPETDAEAQAQAVTLADGSVITPVALEHMVSLEARIGADGRLVVEHSDPSLEGSHVHAHGHAHAHGAKQENPHE